MQNFVFRNPTEIIFGKGSIAQIATRVPKNVPVLMLYGGGSIKNNGVYEQVMAALKGCAVHEFSGIEPNPHFETCVKAVALIRSKNVGFVLAVGGGSVLDAAKFIAAAACHDGDPWEIMQAQGTNIKRALPLGTVLTLPATGSESNGNAVITRYATTEKLVCRSPHNYPVFSVLDPETTRSLPPKQVRNGIVDAFAHVMEQYMTYPAAAPLQDRFAEAILHTLAEVGPKTLAQPNDYDARAAFMWSAAMALNMLIGVGVPQDWSTHMIGHELTAFYGLDHAETLAIVMPGVWQYKFSRKEAKLKQYGERLWGVKSAQEAIEKTEQFFASLGMPTRLSAYKIDAGSAAEKVRARFVQRDVHYGEHQDIDGAAAAAILLSRA